MDTSALIKKRPVDVCKIPAKSSSKYWREYELFMQWCQEKSVKNYDEFVLLAYFHKKSKTLKCPTLWCLFSMLKATLSIKHHINIEKYTKLITFLKTKKDGYVPIKAKTLKIEEFEKFIAEAPNEDYLMMKAVLIIGMCAACRRDQLVQMSIQDIQDRGDEIIIQIPNTKSEKPRTSCITEPLWIEIIRKYTSLRPSGTTRLFLFYAKNKCKRQPVGINTLGSMPSKVATFLNLENPKHYSGYCFQRNSGNILIGHKSGTRHRNQKRSTVAEGYIEDLAEAKITTVSAHSIQNRWTVNQIEALIDQYKKYPVLYDTNHEEYSNAELKSGCLANIVEALQTVRLGVTDEDVTSQWDNLMIKYVEATHVQQAQNSETVANQEPEFRYLNKLQFLQEHTGSTQIKLEDCSTIEYDETKLYDPHTTTELREWRDGTDSLPCSFEIKEEIEDSPPSKKHKDEDSESLESGTSPEDEYDIFGKFVASQLRKITDDEVRQDIIFEVHKMLYKGLKKK